MAADLQRELSTDDDAAAAGLAARVRGLRRSFDDKVVLDGVELDLAQGEFVALLGPSGCGKSTLLRIMADLDHEIDGEVLVARRKAVAFQQPRLLPWKRVWRNVVLGVQGLAGNEGRTRAEQVLAEVGLSDRVDVWPKVLSGGEAQRVSLARALVREPDLLLLDEPFAALDALSRLKAQDLVARLWQSHGPAVLMVTHDVEEAVRLADRVVVMGHGVIEHDIRVDLPRPRDVADPDFVALRARLLGWLGVGTHATDEVAR